MHRTAFSLVAGLLTGWLFLCLPLPASGQDFGVGWRLCEADPPGSAVVRGRLIPQDDAATARRNVRLTEVEGPFHCVVRASPEGDFEFGGVPAGTHQITLEAGGLGPIGGPAPIQLTVEADTLLYFAIPIHGYDPLARCMTMAWCASALTRRTSAELAGPEERGFRLLGYRLAIVMSQGGGGFGPDWVVCVDDTEEVLESLRQAFPNVAPRSECELRDSGIEGVPRLAGELRHLPSDRRARSLYVGPFGRRSETEGNLYVSYHVGPLRGAGFDCRIEKVEGVWLARSCWMTMIV